MIVASAASEATAAEAFVIAGNAAGAFVIAGNAAITAGNARRDLLAMIIPLALMRSDPDVDGTYPNAPPVFPPPQDLSVFRRQCAEDRLQGREAPSALCIRARQDRAKP